MMQSRCKNGGVISSNLELSETCESIDLAILALNFALIDFAVSEHGAAKELQGLTKETRANQDIERIDDANTPLDTPKDDTYKLLEQSGIFVCSLS